ncbi:MAG: antitoxin family protein [Chloroflexota bacterium]
MNQAIRAIYENGVLRPLTALELPDHTEVRIQVETTLDRSEAETHRRAVDDALIVAGLLTPRAVDQAASRPLTDGERDALSRRIRGGRPLSKIILEERDGR